MSRVLGRVDCELFCYRIRQQSTWFFLLLRKTLPFGPHCPKYLLFGSFVHPCYGNTDFSSVLDAFRVMTDGETLMTVEKTRWMTKTVNADCKITQDMMHIVYKRQNSCCLAFKCGYKQKTSKEKTVMLHDIIYKVYRESIFQTIPT